jgi:hypothetical protein
MFLSVLGAPIIVASRAGAADVSPPLVDREASEEAFLTAYDFFLENRLWNCLDHLDDAIGRNTYFVDVYYMRSLVMRRIGRYADAIAAMASYLEVRQDDYRARIIMDEMEREYELLRRTQYSEQLQSALFFERLSTNSFFGIPLYDKVSFTGMKGLGKISSSGGTFFVCDTMGDAVWVSNRSSGPGITRVEAADPVVVAPTSPSEGFLFQKSGDVSRIKLNMKAGSASIENIGSLKINIADAAMIDSTLLVAADRTGQALRFYSIPSLDEVAEWQPADSRNRPKLFEPVAAAVRGPYTAVADRGNAMVYVLDSYTLAILDSFEAELPRDVEWGAQGELYIVSETGSLYRRYPLGSGNIEPEVVAKGFTNSWSMTWTNVGPVISDITARTWWSSRLSPLASGAFGALTLRSPLIEERRDERIENLIFRGEISSVFQSFIQDKTPDTQVVWRGDTRPSKVTLAKAPDAGPIFYYSPKPSENFANGGVRLAGSLSDVMADIASASRSGEKMPSVIVLDTRISGEGAEAEAFFAFLLQQGARLDLWALKRPAAPLLARISQTTLGNAYYTQTLDEIAKSEKSEWVMTLPLPPDTATYGYPSDATLSVFATVDVIQFTDWMPVWPSVITRERAPRANN